VTRWLVEGLIPAGAIVTFADLDDPPPQELLARGIDVVLYVHDRGPASERPVLFSCHWREGLVPGHEPPKPFWIKRVGDGYVRIEEAAA
jgi:hypothetical protein